MLEVAGTKRWLLIGSMILAVTATLAQFLPFVSIYEILTELARNAAAPLSIDKEVFTQKASGEIKKNMTEDVERIENFVAHHIPDLTSAIIFPYSSSVICSLPTGASPPLS